MAKKANRRAWLFKGKGKLRGRTCVGVAVDKAPRSAVKGVKLKPVRYYGCYVSKAKAERKRDVLAAKSRLG